MKTLRFFSRLGVPAAALFTGLALSLSATLHAQLTPPEAPSPANLFLPPTGGYAKEASSPDIVWANGVRCRAFKIELPANSLVPPAAGLPPQIQSVDCTLRVELSNNGGASYQAVTMPATVTVRLTFTSTNVDPNNGGQNYDAEWMGTAATGPGPLRFRESPTLASTGKHTIRPVPDGSFRVSSFFDIFTEISLDAGQNWSPASAAVHCALTEPGECATSSSSLPSVECVIAGQSDIVFANGVVLHDVRLRNPSSSLPPPPPGGSQLVAFTTHASGQIRGGGYQVADWGGDCIGTCLYTSQLDSGGARFFNTEMLALSLSGGGLPTGVMVRESPSKASLGRTSVRASSDGQNYIGSFFDVFTEISLDGGVTWSPSTGSPTVFKGELVGLEPVTYIWPTDAPLPAADYRTIVTANPSTLTFDASNFQIASLAWSMAPGGTVTSSATGSTYAKRGEAEVNLSLNGGVSFVTARSDVAATFVVGAETSTGDRPVECVSFTITNTGSVPTGALLRESPSRPSLGQIRKSIKAGHYAVSNFFDIFLEVSADGGATWSVANDPLRLVLSPSVGVDTFDSGFFPPRDGAFSQGGVPYYRPENDVTSYGASAVRVRHFRYHQWTRSQPPPITPGTPQIQNANCEMVCEISFDGGLSYSPVTAPASGDLRTTRRATSIAVFDTEMLSMSMSGGGLPPGVMIRESPTKQSLGVHRVFPTVLSDGRVRVSSFFDIFTEVSLDGGATWTPSDSSTHLELSRNVPEIFSSSDWLPLDGQMEGDEDSGTTAYGDRTIVRKVIIVITDGNQNRVPPPAPAADITKVSAITMRFAKSLDGGTTFTDETASGTMTVKTHGSSGGGGGGGAGGLIGYDTEMLQLDVSGGALPAGVMLRESPTKQSLGGSVKRVVDGGYRIGSFFDIFTEISLDGGATWAACDQPVHVERITSGQPKIVENNLLLPPGDFLSPPGGVSLRCATGKHIKDAKLSRMAGSTGVPPPPVGGTVSGSQNYEISFLYSDDDGVSYTRKSGAFTAADFDYKATSYRNDTTNYDSEITALPVSGGTLPAGMMLRESPTKQSLGKTVSRVLPDGTFFVNSFFDIFTELSVDGGTTWEPFDQALHVELENVLITSIVATDAYPPPDRFAQKTGDSLSFPALTSIGSLELRFTSPPSPRPPLGAAAFYVLDGTAQCVLRVAGSPPVAAACPISAQVIETHTYDDGAVRVFDTEMLKLNLGGGSFPAGVLIRESPTLPSKGKTSLRTQATGFAIESFFDVFCEISLDGGANWSPSDGPVRIVFPGPLTPPTVTIAPATDLTWKSATLHGTVNPNGKPTSAQFEALLGSTLTTVSVTLSPNDGTTAQTVSATLDGLLPARTYHGLLRATNADGTVTTADIVFTTPDKPFRVWKLTYLGDANAPDLGTPDHDGITNLMKYALVLPPGSSSVHLLPQPQIHDYADGNRLALTFLRDPSRSDITIEVQFARSLHGPWITVATSTSGAPFTGPGFVGEVDVPGFPGVKRVEVRDTIPKLSVSIAFAKITVTY